MTAAFAGHFLIYISPIIGLKVLIPKRNAYLPYRNAVVAALIANNLFGYGYRVNTRSHHVKF